MLKGIFLQADREKQPFALRWILHCSDVEKYDWYNIMSQNETWADASGAEFLDEKFYTGKALSQRMEQDYLMIIFLKLQAYLKSGIFYDIHTYEDFLASDCQLLILISDDDYFDIYSKDQTSIQTLYQMAFSEPFIDVKLLTTENDQRYKLDVL